ncbi:hypothetical protein BD311DRAFT_436838 [Dichomitus squalens]|uniref:Uncharacterized protein n=1 Tax=Dichomitus squalens TaxID=114155 RepID=A0A4Q9N0R7_9APHY|nr:hypothetical protein BD311DRAFT_436838 [Dichomitus squalens]
MGGLPVLDRVAYAFHRELCQAASFARLSAISPPRQDARHPPRQQSSAPRILLPLIVSHPPSLFLHLASAVLLAPVRCLLSLPQARVVKTTARPAVLASAECENPAVSQVDLPLDMRTDGWSLPCAPLRTSHRACRPLLPLRDHSVFPAPCPLRCAITSRGCRFDQPLTACGP